MLVCLFHLTFEVDYIYVMKEGTLVEGGTYEQLVTMKNSEFARLNSNYEVLFCYTSYLSKYRLKFLIPKNKQVRKMREWAINRDPQI